MFTFLKSTKKYSFSRSRQVFQMSEGDGGGTETNWREDLAATNLTEDVRNEAANSQKAALLFSTSPPE